MREIPATKSNLLKVKKQYSFIQEGHSLLDEKRKILMLELTSIVHVADKLQKDVDTALKQAYALVDKAAVMVGEKKLNELAMAVDIKNELSISGRAVMGVNLPMIRLNIRDNPPYYSALGVSMSVDEVIASFKEVMELLVRLAEKKIAFLRISRELQKTIRKVNALEKIHMPYYRANLKSITDRLEEESRESFFMLKLIKKRRRN